MYKKQIKYFTTGIDEPVSTTQREVNLFLLSLDPSCVHDVKMQEYFDGQNYQISFLVIYEKSI